MIIDVNASNPSIGNVQGVQVWSMPTYTDERGRLFKAYTTADTGIFPIPFNTYEHFFTESKKEQIMIRSFYLICDFIILLVSCNPQSDSQLHVR